MRTIGTDPEVFFVDSQGSYVSAHGLLPGTKTEPHYVPKGAVQVDGTAGEFNTAPAATSAEFYDNISSVLSTMTEMVREVRPDLTVAITPCAFYGKEYFDNLPEEVKLLGCEPDYNGYTGDENVKPVTTEPFRTGSGHLHVAFDVPDDNDEHFQKCCGMARQLDLILFVTSLLWDDDQKRRELYGNPGSFRVKPFGFEYRPMSNMYLSRKSIIEFCFDASVKAADDYESGTRYEESGLGGKMASRILDRDYPSKSEAQDYLRAMNKEFGTPLWL